MPSSLSHAGLPRLVGIEGGLDRTLRGRAGEKSVQVNNLGYRRGGKHRDQAVPGAERRPHLDLGVQRAAEAALRKIGPSGRGAVVVMDVRTGDILAMASPDVQSEPVRPSHVATG